MIPGLTPRRPPRLAARPDGVRLRCANVACGRHLPGVWLVPLDGHPAPVLVLDRAWSFIPRSRTPHIWRLSQRARRSRDFLHGRRPVSDYADAGAPSWRRPNVTVPGDPAPEGIECPHCGVPQRLPASGACVDCRSGGGHDRDLHAAWVAML
jgi:hypothetical protein